MVLKAFVEVLSLGNTTSLLSCVLWGISLDIQGEGL